MKTCFVLLLLLCASAWAHEIGTTKVSARFGGARYDIEVITDAAALREKLQATGGTLLQRVALRFDGADVQPKVVMKAQMDGSEVIHLTGPVPEGAREFTWKFGWTFASYAFQVGEHIEWLEGGEESRPISLRAAMPPSRWQVIRQYLALGFTHILPHGLDHMLFVLGIYLLTGRLRATLLPVTAFTIAHSVSLGLSMYGLVSAPSSVVEPAIAISIAYVAIENLFLREVRRWRIALVFAFGLLHGLGFAGALGELGLPRTEFAAALVSFNVGVELAQIAVIGVAFALIGGSGRAGPGITSGWWCRVRSRSRVWRCIGRSGG
ncbi:MAG: HupE/UreJ family protein [Acidobacteriota bacterium]